MRNKHIHKYKKIDIGGFKNPYMVYACTLPNCTHYIPEERAVGKMTLCWVCDKPFEIKKGDLKYVKIACNRCKGKRVRNPEIRARMERSKVERVEATDMLEALMNIMDEK